MPPSPVRPGRPGDGPGLDFRSRGGVNTEPSVTALTPNAGRIGGGLAVTLRGTNFTGQPVVLFGANPATSVVVVDPTTLTCVTPAALGIGLVDVTVTVGSQDGVLAGAFTYYAGMITEVTPNYSLESGGVVVRIIGINFIAGSTIFFDATPATGVIFIDDQQFLATVPASPEGVGPVDVVVVEPDTTEVIGRGLFRYTGIIPVNDIRRLPSITVQDNLNNAPNVAEFMVDGNSAPPQTGQGVQLVDNGVLMFAGQAQTVDTVIEDDRSNLCFKVRAIDPTSRFNALRPFGTFDNQSVSDVAQILVSQYAPDFTANHVQTKLARISIVLDGTQDMATVMSILAAATGEGHWYVDYLWDLHLYHVPLLNVHTNVVPTRPISYGPGTPIVLSQSTTPQSGAMVPGYYYVRHNFGYSSAATMTAPLVAAPTGYAQLSDQAAALNLTGAVQNGEYYDGVTFFGIGWVGYRGAALLTTPPATLIAGDYYFASQGVATVLEAQALANFETSLGPISNVLLVQTYIPTMASIPLGANIGGRTCTYRNIFFVRFGNFHGGSGTPTTGYIRVADNVTTTITLEPTYEPTVPVQGVVNAPAGAPTAPAIYESTTLIDPSEFLGIQPQIGYYGCVISGVYLNGTESLPSSISNNVYLSGPYKASVLYCPIYPDVNGIPCVFRKIYLSIVFPYHPPVPGIPDFGPNTTNLTELILDNTSTEALIAVGSGLVGGDPVLNRPQGVPVGIQTATNNPDGPWLEGADSPDDIDDENMDLLREPALTFSVDDSQLRNRIYVKGRSTIIAQDAAVGATTVYVADVGIFSPAGGQAIYGSHRISYAALSAEEGAGALLLSAPLTQPILQADWKFGGGTPIKAFIQVDDLESQRSRGLIELDKLGRPTSGIHEYTIDDANLTTVEQCVARGLAELQLFSRPTVKVRYSTTDPKSRSGKVVHFDLSKPAIYGDFIIQSVFIDQYRDEGDDLVPRYNVIADSAARFEFDDLILDLDDRKNGGEGTNFAGLFPTATTQTIAATAHIAVVEIYLTNAQIKALFSTPIKVVDAPGVGKVNIPLHMLVHQYFPSFGYSASRTLGIRFATTTTLQTTTWAAAQNDILSCSTPVTASRDRHSFVVTAGEVFTDRNTPANGGGYAVNKPLLVTMTNSDVTGGDAANYITIRLTYMVADAEPTA